ncbi:MAG: hypothetical protein PCFJNLEI_03057 [Verrucomicrobiae bacterium]|nr:hypothetical protein [Verrucomicrobiae bacterium]
MNQAPPHPLRQCNFCRRVQTESNQWQHLTAVVSAPLTNAVIAAICPRCYEDHVRSHLAGLFRAAVKEPSCALMA